MILENLRKAGVQNTVREEHLDFDSLEPFPGELVHLRVSSRTPPAMLVRLRSRSGPSTARSVRSK